MESQWLSFGDRLISFILTSSRFIHAATCVEISFFSRLKSIPLSVYPTFCVSIHPSRDTRLLLPLGYCEQCCYEHGCTDIWILAVNSSGYKCRSGIAGSYSVIRYLISWGTTTLFSIEAASYYVPAKLYLFNLKILPSLEMRGFIIRSGILTQVCETLKPIPDCTPLPQHGLCLRPWWSVKVKGEERKRQQAPCL